MDYYARHQALEVAVSQLLKALATISVGLPREEVLAAALVKVQSERRGAGKWTVVEPLPPPESAEVKVPAGAPPGGPAALQGRETSPPRKLLKARVGARKLTRPTKTVSKTGKAFASGRQSTDGTFSSLLLSTLAKNPGISIGELAVAVYADDKEATSKVRSLLSMLKGQGKVDNPTPGRWEVVQKKEG
jgi:hypothetical protein